jgi:hypothetical protein
MKEYYQQGDVIIEPLENYGLDFPTDGKVVKAEHRGFILARGEVTGHAHALEDIEGVEVIERPLKIKLKTGVEEEVKYFIRIKGNQLPKLKHEEHNLHVISLGEYIVRGIREYDHFTEEARRVQD